MNGRQQLEQTMRTIDKELMELQIISAVRNLREMHPGHPFVVAITAVLELVQGDNPDQLHLKL